MTTEELERLIEGQTEAQTLDFKDDCPWDTNSFAKDFLAMSNVQDGGILVIGVKQMPTGFEPVGISDVNLKTYNYDDMKDKLASFSEPAMQFRVDIPKDSRGRQYVVIKIFPFSEIPVLSKKDIPKELRSNTIYYRNTDKRPQSAPISNIGDLQDLIERAAIKLIERRKKFGYTIPSESDGTTEKIIEHFNPNDLAGKIKSKGYWLIYFEPNKPEKISSIKHCAQLVEKSKVRANWDFPVTTFPGLAETGSEFYQFSSEFGPRKQIWRMYKSGLFLSYNALPEDWYADSDMYQELAKLYPSQTTLTVFNSVTFFLSSVFSFLNRLVTNHIYEYGIKVHLELKYLNNRKLRLDNNRYTDLMNERRTLSMLFSDDLHLNSTDILTGHQRIANEVIIKLLDSFSYNPSSNSILAEQEAYLSGKI